ncbi:MAG: YggS family pyridoxal phosphate-dependent enzyme [Bacteroidia bacterium]|jgi:hypothetical protein
MSNAANIQKINAQISPSAKLIAVSKTKPVELIQEAYDAGQRDFGENKVQEMASKAPLLPADIRWHLIGHLQSNKVKYIAPFVYMIHSVDSLKLLEVIDKEGRKNNRVIPCLLQVHIATEETKFGLDAEELQQLIEHLRQSPLSFVVIKGLMGMATNTSDENVIRKEFKHLKGLFDTYAKQQDNNIQMQELSMGMSSDYLLAVESGSTLVRIGSSVFGER